MIRPWNTLDPLERRALMAVASLHKEFGADTAWDSGAVAHVVGEPVVAELGFLTGYGLLELMPDRRGYRLTGEGMAALPESAEKVGLREHRVEADQALREEQ